MISAWVAILLSGPQAVAVPVPPGHHPYSMMSASMEPNFREGDVVMADRPRGDCGSTTPDIGDVVVFRWNDTPYIKRVVAGPGQTVQMQGGVLFVDDKPVKREPVETPAAASVSMYGLAVETWRETLPNGESYLIQDFGPGMEFDDTPLVRVPGEQWFLLGDNRDNSLDSRFSGPISSDDICGAVTGIVSSPSETASKTP